MLLTSWSLINYRTYIITRLPVNTYLRITLRSRFRLAPLHLKKNITANLQTNILTFFRNRLDQNVKTNLKLILQSQIRNILGLRYSTHDLVRWPTKPSFQITKLFRNIIINLFLKNAQNTRIFGRAVFWKS